ncbi:hypothetical protein TNCV_4054501 [Trichonephila clavipes]|nr:hypothetical protein TNCV_4054501 [Trichonephila clavipes]
MRYKRNLSTKQNRGEKDEKKDQYLKSLPHRGRLEENGRTRTKLVRHEGENGGAQERGLFSSQNARNEKEKSLQGETYRRHSRCNEAGASFNTDPRSDERQMHLNVVKCSN